MCFFLIRQTFSNLPLLKTPITTAVPRPGIFNWSTAKGRRGRSFPGGNTDGNPSRRRYRWYQDAELAIFQEITGVLRCLCRKRYRNALFSGVEEVLAQFFSDFSLRPLLACIAVAGVVSGDRVQLTNLPWQLDARSLAMRFGWQRVQLINDVTAIASSLAHLAPEDMVEIQPGERAAGEIRGIIAPGNRSWARVGD